MSNAKANGLLSIPAASRKMVQNLKEIVNCPEHEIYAMLKECNMDPNDTVNRLLSQDTFHEVKSKREKKKELKEGAESRSRGASSSSNRGGRGGSDRNVGRSSSTQFSSADSGVMRGKPAYKKENGSNTITSPSPASGLVGNNSTRRSASFSESVSTENTVQAAGTADGVSLPSQPSSGFQPAWLGVPGQVSMADIVKMGRPHRRASNLPITTTEASYPPHNAVMPNTLHPSVNHPPIYTTQASESHHELHSSQGPVSKVSEIIHEPSIGVNQHVSQDDWTLAEQLPAASGPSILEPSGASAVYVDPSSSLHLDGDNWHLTSGSNEVQATEGHAPTENLGAGIPGVASASDRHIQVESSGGASHFDDRTFEDRSSHQPQRHAFEHQEGIGGSPHLSVTEYPAPSSSGDVSVAVSSAATSLQQLSLHKEDLGAPPADNNPAVIIPDHLQVPTADCSHLSFGSFGSGLSAPFSGTFTSKSLKNNLEDAPVSADVSSVAADVPPLEHTNNRNAENYSNESVISSSNEIVDSASSSQPEVVKRDTTVEASQGPHYAFPSVSGYSFENTAQTNTASYSYPQTNSQMQSLAPFSNQPYVNSLPTNLMSSSLQPLRESDIPYSPFLATQSMPTKYSSAVSSISGATLSMPEALKPSVFSSPQPTPQSLPSTSLPAGPAAPQHLPVHPYSQPTLPLGHFTSMVSYPFLPSYTYLPSAFQQTYAGNSAYHQSPAAVHGGGVKYSLPQYKNSISVSSLPQSATVASGYGGFGSSANIPGSFTLNPSTTPPSTTVSYEDVMSSQYKESNHYGSVQQNEGSAMWIHGPGSRTISALPASTYYSLQGQNQNSGFRQGQQPSQYGSLGYPTFYHSQASVSQEHQQTPSDGSLSASQGPPSQPSHQIWQHNY
ncbi:hypothetical protein AAC387_Pa06g1062 [Persea americana]